MSVPSFRNSRSKVRRRRSHHALQSVQVSLCAKCGASNLPHVACKACGTYNGRQVATVKESVEKVLDKKVAKASKATKPSKEQDAPGAKKKIKKEVKKEGK